MAKWVKVTGNKTLTLTIKEPPCKEIKIDANTDSADADSKQAGHTAMATGNLFLT